MKTFLMTYWGLKESSQSKISWQTLFWWIIWRDSSWMISQIFSTFSFDLLNVHHLESTLNHPFQHNVTKSFIITDHYQITQSWLIDWLNRLGHNLLLFPCLFLLNCIDRAHTVQEFSTTTFYIQWCITKEN